MVSDEDRSRHRPYRPPGAVKYSASSACDLTGNRRRISTDNKRRQIYARPIRWGRGQRKVGRCRRWRAALLSRSRRDSARWQRGRAGRTVRCHRSTCGERDHTHLSTRRMPLCRALAPEPRSRTGSDFGPNSGSPTVPGTTCVFTCRCLPAPLKTGGSVRTVCTPEKVT